MSTYRSPLFVEPLDAVAAASAPDFQRDLSRYWRHVRKKENLGLTTRGRLYKSALQPLLQALNMPPETPESEEELPRLWFMRLLLTGLNELVEARARLSVNSDGRFFQLPLTSRVRRSYEAWQATSLWNEFAGLGDLRRDGLAAWVKARASVLRAMARIEKSLNLDRSIRPQQAVPTADAWISTAALIDAVSRPDQSLAHERSHLLDRPAVLSMLAGPLHWLGLVDLGTTRDSPLPAAYRLTDVGLWLLDLAPEPAFVEHGGRVLVQPNFTILAMEPISDSVLMDLDQFSDLQGSDRATTYHLTRQSVYRGQRAGWDVGRIIQFLEKRQSSPLPANVLRSLEEWQSLHHRIVVYRNACVLQYADDMARDGARGVLAPLLERLVPLGPGYDLAEQRRSPPRGTNLHSAPGLTSQVVAALSEAGWMPQYSPANTADTEGCLRASPGSASQDPDAAGLEVVFKQAVPSVHALGQLSIFAEIAPGASHGTRLAARLTPASLKAALSHGVSLDEILAILAHLHDGALPVQVEDSVRSWARFYGTASINAVCLIEFSDADVLNNLLDDADVGQHLQPIEGSIRALATIDPAHVETVRELLQERGIQPG